MNDRIYTPMELADEADRLANEIEWSDETYRKLEQMGAEIRRLDAVKKDLLEALEYIDSENASAEVLRRACAAIAKATGVQS